MEERAGRAAGDLLIRKVGDGSEVSDAGGGEERGGGVTVDEFQNPAGGDVLDEEGAVRERSGPAGGGTG